MISDYPCGSVRVLDLLVLSVVPKLGQLVLADRNITP